MSKPISDSEYDHKSSEHESAGQEDEAQLRDRVRRLENLVRQQQETINLFNNLFYASPIPICISRFEDGRCLYVNDAFLRYFGWERNEVVGRTDLELGFWPDQGQRQAFMERVRQEGQITREGRIAPAQAEETRRYALSSISYAETEEDAYVISAYVDVTERVAAETQVKRLAAALFQAEHRERKRVGQLLHDDIQQMLYSVQLDLQNLAGQSTGETSATASELADRVGNAIDATRTLSFELNAAALESDRLGDLLDWLTVVKENKYGLKLHVHQEGTIVIEERARRQMLLRALRELLFNVVKHAGVDEATLRAEVHDQTLRVEIADDGVGFDPAQTGTDGDEASPGGSGLDAIRERLRFIGGTLTVDSVPGQGTRCIVTLPLDDWPEALKRDRHS